MFDRLLKGKSSGIPSALRKTAAGRLKRSCAALLGATTLVSLSVGLRRARRHEAAKY
jgi:hypothetical protein